MFIIGNAHGTPGCFIAETVLYGPLQLADFESIVPMNVRRVSGRRLELVYRAWGRGETWRREAKGDPNAPLCSAPCMIAL
jgi:hypothetical protein